MFPALKTDRYKIYKRDGRPVGYVSIALLSKAVEQLWLAGGYILQPEDWISGDRTWIMDFVAPFGDAETVRQKVGFEPEVNGKVVRALRPDKRGKGLRVVTFGVHQLRHQSDWTSRLVNQPEGAAVPARYGADRTRRMRRAERMQPSSGGPMPLPHVRDLLWTTPDNWLHRCCVRYKFRDEDLAPPTEF